MNETVRLQLARTQILRGQSSSDSSHVHVSLVYYVIYVHAALRYYYTRLCSARVDDRPFTRAPGNPNYNPHGQLQDFM